MKMTKTLLTIIGFVCFCKEIWANEIGGFCIDSNPLSPSISVDSYMAIKDKNVIKQTKDDGCGLASLATLLKYGYGRDISEQDIVKVIKYQEGKETTMTQLTEAAKVIMAPGVEIYSKTTTLKNLSDRQDRPLIVHIRPKNAPEHFSVLKGICNGYAYLADPSRGNVQLSIKEFEELWVITNSNDHDLIGKGKFLGIGKTTTTNLLSPPKNCKKFSQESFLEKGSWYFK